MQDISLNIVIHYPSSASAHGARTRPQPPLSGGTCATADGLYGDGAAADYFNGWPFLPIVAFLGRTGTDKKDHHDAETDKCFFHNPSLEFPAKPAECEPKGPTEHTVF